MLEKAADTFIAAVELLEAEGRQLRRTGADLTFWAVIIVGASILALLGIATVLVGATWALAEALGVAAALAIIGAAALISGVAVASVARSRMRAAGGSVS
ncbi:hypothetical protein AY599_20740 [Leptolyngbya valderiana BDU 20041]|nr:hypothetical protein AY599_20740 [Leptolyngbya valderiana BDU 20041]